VPSARRVTMSPVTRTSEETASAAKMVPLIVRFAVPRFLKRTKAEVLVGAYSVHVAAALLFATRNESSDVMV
jgi:hypothetical protein